MIGAIIGDIIGSRFEFNNHKSKEFELFTGECRVTDDSIMTLAIAKSIIETEKIIKSSFGGYNHDSEYYSILEEISIKYMQEIGLKYPNCGYGGMFRQWVFSNNPKPYNSFGNGSAMRISPVGFAARSAQEACELSKAVTKTTHNHHEGIKGAEATALAIFMARRGATKREIRNEINRKYYSLDFKIDEIRDAYEFNATCQGSVPQAIVAFLESTSFEDAIRIAISIGGDSDTLAAITGSIAEAYYGVPEEIKSKALSYLDKDLLKIYDEWCEFIKDKNDNSKFKVLTKYIGQISSTEFFDKDFAQDENKNIRSSIFREVSKDFNDIVNIFVEEFYDFSESHPEYNLTNYAEILEENCLKWDDKSMRSAYMDSLDEKCTLALIMGGIRADRFCDGALLSFFKDGFILKWLKRLRAIDDSHINKTIEEIYFEIGGFHQGYNTYYIIFKEDTSVLKITPFLENPVEKHYSVEEAERLRKSFTGLHVEYWKSKYVDLDICDGTQWKLTVRYQGERGCTWHGDNDYPANWDRVLEFFYRKF